MHYLAGLPLGMFEKKEANNANIITQGDDGDNFYVLGAGTADVSPCSIFFFLKVEAQSSPAHLAPE